MQHRLDFYLTMHLFNLFFVIAILFLVTLYLIFTISYLTMRLFRILNFFFVVVNSTN